MAEIIKDRVKESSTTTGTGPFAVSGAGTGFRTFGSVCSVGDTFRCSMVADDGSWQVGVARYSAANEVTFDSVVDSSNGGSPVSFAAGTKQLFIGMDATEASWIRERLTAARTYYVRTDGNDSNSGLADTAGGAFLTIQKAMDVIADTLDVANQTVTIQIGDGTYTTGVAIRPMVGRGSLILNGNSGTPANVTIHTTSGSAISATVFARATVQNLRVQTTTTGFGIVAQGGSQIQFSSVVFAACATGHLFVDGTASITAVGNYSITGAANVHVQATAQGRFVCWSRVVTITGTPAFATAFAYVDALSVLLVASNTYSGAATGTRYSVLTNGVINTGGGGATYLPGSVAGSVSSGGQYV